MQQILVVLEARHFEQLAFAIALQRHCYRPRAGEDDRIIHRRLVLNPVRAHWRQSLDDGGGMTDDIADFVQPRLAVEIRGLDDKRIALPAAKRIALPESDSIRQMRTAVQR